MPATKWTCKCPNANTHDQTTIYCDKCGAINGTDLTVAQEELHAIGEVVGAIAVGVNLPTPKEWKWMGAIDAQNSTRNTGEIQEVSALLRTAWQQLEATPPTKSTILNCLTQLERDLDGVMNRIAASQSGGRRSRTISFAALLSLINLTTREIVRIREWNGQGPLPRVWTSFCFYLRYAGVNDVDEDQLTNTLFEEVAALGTTLPTPEQWRRETSKWYACRRQSQIALVDEALAGLWRVLNARSNQAATTTAYTTLRDACNAYLQHKGLRNLNRTVQGKAAVESSRTGKVFELLRAVRRELELVESHWNEYQNGQLSEPTGRYAYPGIGPSGGENEPTDDPLTDNDVNAISSSGTAGQPPELLTIEDAKARLRGKSKKELKKALLQLQVNVGSTGNFWTRVDGAQDRLDTMQALLSLTDAALKAANEGDPSGFLTDSDWAAELRCVTGIVGLIPALRKVYHQEQGSGRELAWASFQAGGGLAGGLQIAEFIHQAQHADGFGLNEAWNLITTSRVNGATQDAAGNATPVSADVLGGGDAAQSIMVGAQGFAQFVSVVTNAVGMKAAVDRSAQIKTIGGRLTEMETTDPIFHELCRESYVLEFMRTHTRHKLATQECWAKFELGSNAAGFIGNGMGLILTGAALTNPVGWAVAGVCAGFTVSKLGARYLRKRWSQQRLAEYRLRHNIPSFIRTVGGWHRYVVASIIYRAAMFDPTLPPRYHAIGLRWAYILFGGESAGAAVMAARTAGVPGIIQFVSKG